MGVQYRWDNPSFYRENTPFVLWANRYQETGYRVVDSARLFARGYLGPNATDVGKVYVLNNTDPRSIANSLAASDLCPVYNDTSGGENATTWANIYLPPIVARINKLVPGLNFTASDVVQFPVLCGFETQITGKTSPWCNVFQKNEIEQFEYAQDIRYVCVSNAITHRDITSANLVISVLRHWPRLRHRKAAYATFLDTVGPAFCRRPKCDIYQRQRDFTFHSEFTHRYLYQRRTDQSARRRDRSIRCSSAATCDQNPARPDLQIKQLRHNAWDHRFRTTQLRQQRPFHAH